MSEGRQIYTYQPSCANHSHSIEKMACPHGKWMEGVVGVGLGIIKFTI
jgi:hypothetical protein